MLVQNPPPFSHSSYLSLFPSLAACGNILIGRRSIINEVHTIDKELVHSYSLLQQDNVGNAVCMREMEGGAEW